MTNDDYIEIFLSAKKSIERGFTRYVFAADAKGRETLYNDPWACKFCLTGALMRAIWMKYEDTDLQKFQARIGEVAAAFVRHMPEDPDMPEVPGPGREIDLLYYINDTHCVDKEDMLRYLDAVIHRLETKEGVQ